MKAEHFDEVEIEDRAICFECVGEAFLRAEIQKDGRSDTCFYCEGERRTFSIGEMANRIKVALDRHFYRTASEPTGMEYAMMKEGDYDWEREGDSVSNIIEQYVHIEPDAAEDIREVLEGRYFDMELAQIGDEGPFDADAYYAEASVDDTESQAGWLEFEQTLKTEARYFSRSAEWKLKFVFEGIADQQTDDGCPVIVEAGPLKPINSIYRARVFQSHEKLEHALKRPDRELGPPPHKSALAGRMNPHGISVLYGATDPMVALAEVRPPVASRVVVGRFELIRHVRLLDVEALRKLNVEGSIFDKTYLSRLEKAKFLGWLSHRIAMPVTPEDEPYAYLATQAIADFLAMNADPILDGILYPSVQGSEGKSNVVLFHKAARVQALDIPKGTKISASLYDHTEDGPEINYWVREEVDPGFEAATPETRNSLFLSEAADFNGRDYNDGRAETLKLDTASLEVHCVRSVLFTTKSHKVHRHRFEKKDPEF